MNILIIEDDKLTLNLLQFCIQNLGHTAFLANNADQALPDILNGKYDLLITDIMMPGISGLSLVHDIRSEKKCNIPIIMMSALNNKPLLEKAFEAGANDFIAKPFSMEDLAEKLKKYDTKAEVPKQA